MIGNYLEQRWFRLLISAAGFAPLLAFELYGLPWFSVAYIAALVIVAAGVAVKGDL